MPCLLQLFIEEREAKSPYITQRKQPCSRKGNDMNKEERLRTIQSWQRIMLRIREHEAGERYSQTTLKRKTDFVKLAEAFGAKGFRADDKASLDIALKQALESDGPCLIDCIIDKDDMVMPMIPPGKSVDCLLMRFR